MDVELLFLGTGTSAGIPMIGCHCPVCSSSDARDKRTRPSVVISYPSNAEPVTGAGETASDGRARVLVDTTPELRIQCIAHRVQRIDAVVYTHAHADHIMGLDDVRRFNALKGGPLDVYMDERTHKTISRCFGYAFIEPDPESKLFRPHPIPRTIAGPFDIAGVTWTPIPLMHGELPVLGFRVGNLAYCTDVSFIPDSSYELLENLDVLVLDAPQHKRHTTHFSLEQAMEAAARIRAKRTLFTHIAHALGHVETNRLLPENMQLAFDGQVVTAGLA